LKALAAHEKRNFNPDDFGQPDNGRDGFGPKRCANQIGTCWLLDESSPRIFDPRQRSNANVSDSWTQPRDYDEPVGCTQNGMFYQDGEPYKIVKLTQSEFDYEAVRESGVRVDGKFVLTCPVGTVFPLYRTTRAMAEQ
jgi:hypothetical protein